MFTTPEVHAREHTQDLRREAAQQRAAKQMVSLHRWQYLAAFANSRVHRAERRVTEVSAAVTTAAGL